MIKKSLASIRSAARVAAFALAIAAPRAHAADPMAAAPAPAGGPELVIGHNYEKPPLQATPLPFTKSDFLNIVRDPVPARIKLGQPLDVPLRLINHTRFKASMLTNLNPRGNMTVMIQQIRPTPKAERQYFGPYMEGNYSPTPILLYPLEELPARMLLWTDRATPNGLAFPEPGDYQVKVTIQITAELSKASGNITLDPFVISVDPPEEGDKPLIEELSKNLGFAELQMRRVPEGKLEAWSELALKYPKSTITPYLNYTVGLNYYALMVSKDLDTALFEKASKHLQLGASVPSTAKQDILENLAHLYDRVGAADMARQMCEEALKATPPGTTARYGSGKLYRKYLINSAELDPIRYWDILE